MNDTDRRVHQIEDLADEAILSSRKGDKKTVTLLISEIEELRSEGGETVFDATRAPAASALLAAGNL